MNCAITHINPLSVRVVTAPGALESCVTIHFQRLAAEALALARHGPI